MQEIYNLGDRILDRFTIFDSPESVLTCIKERCATEKFTDTEFPATNESCYPNEKEEQVIKWERISEIYPGAPLFSSGTMAWEVAQGQIGNCGTIANLLGLAQSKSDFAIEHMIYPRKYDPDVGAFLVRFNYFDEFKWVLVDDYLPLLWRGQPRFCHPLNNDGAYGFWMAIAEKAAAKIRGCYLNLTNDFSGIEGHTRGAFGGNCWYPTTSRKVSSFEGLQTVIQGGGYGICAFSREDAAELPGLVSGHAYAVLDWAQIPDKDDTTLIHDLVWLENPWGGGRDFESIWGDDSPEWEDYPQYKYLLEKTNKTGGSQWVEFEQIQALTNIGGIVPADFDALLYLLIHDLSAPNSTGEFEIFHPNVISITSGFCPVIPSSGDRHIQWQLFDENETLIHKSKWAWWGRGNRETIELEPGKYQLRVRPWSEGYTGKIFFRIELA